MLLLLPLYFCTYVNVCQNILLYCPYIIYKKCHLFTINDIKSTSSRHQWPPADNLEIAIAKAASCIRGSHYQTSPFVWLGHLSNRAHLAELISIVLHPSTIPGHWVRTEFGEYEIIFFFLGKQHVSQKDETFPTRFRYEWK